jgi:hypothetical protein
LGHLSLNFIENIPDRLLEPVQNLEFWRCKRQNSTLQAPKEPENRDFCGLLTAKIHNLNRLLEQCEGIRETRNLLTMCPLYACVHRIQGAWQGLVRAFFFPFSKIGRDIGLKEGKCGGTGEWGLDFQT